MSIPEWVQNLVLITMGSVGTMVLGLLVSRNKDRSEFTGQVLERLRQVEAAQREERQYCEAKIADLRATIRERDMHIEQLRKRVETIEREGK